MNGTALLKTVPFDLFVRLFCVYLYGFKKYNSSQ